MSSLFIINVPGLSPNANKQYLKEKDKQNELQVEAKIKELEEDKNNTESDVVANTDDHSIGSNDASKDLPEQNGVTETTKSVPDENASAATTSVSVETSSSEGESISHGNTVDTEAKTQSSGQARESDTLSAVQEEGDATATSQAISSETPASTTSDTETNKGVTETFTEGSKEEESEQAPKEEVTQDSNVESTDTHPANDNMTQQQATQDEAIQGNNDGTAAVLETEESSTVKSVNFAPLTESSKHNSSKEDNTVDSQLLKELFSDKSDQHDFSDMPSNIVNDFIVHAGIDHVSCVPYSDDEGPKCMFMFQIEKDDCEKYFNRLQTLGIGVEGGAGNVQVIPMSMAAVSTEAPSPSDADIDLERGPMDTSSETKSRVKSKRMKFNETIKSRIAVTELSALVRESAGFSFDYLSLVTIASILALVGLCVNSTVVIVASMLVSPLMGPILAFTFGTVVYDVELATIGLFTELKGLAICVLVGFFGGLIATPFCHNEYGWPTEEMGSRGTWQGVVVGIFVAIPSGLGVALSILGKNTSSLVGVAISASLLPPAVNSGLLIAFAALASSVDNPADTIDVATKAGYSFLLCLINIVIVWGMGVAMFRFKEVALHSDTSTGFWKRDLAAARHFNTVARNSPEGKNMREVLRKALERSKKKGADRVLLRDSSGLFGEFNHQKHNGILYNHDKAGGEIEGIQSANFFREPSLETLEEVDEMSLYELFQEDKHLKALGKQL